MVRGPWNVIKSCRFPKIQLDQLFQLIHCRQLVQFVNVDNVDNVDESSPSSVSFSPTEYANTLPPTTRTVSPFSNSTSTASLPPATATCGFNPDSAPATARTRTPRPQPPNTAPASPVHATTARRSGITHSRPTLALTTTACGAASNSVAGRVDTTRAAANASPWPTVDTVKSVATAGSAPVLIPRIEARRAYTAADEGSVAASSGPTRLSVGSGWLVTMIQL